MVTGLAAVAAAAVAVARAAADAPFVLVATQRTGSAWIEQTLKDRVCDVDADVEIMLDNDWCDDEAHARQKQYSDKKRTAAREGRRRLHGHCERNLTLHRLALEALFDPSAPVPAGLEHRSKFRKSLARARSGRAPTAFGFKWMTNQGLEELWPWFLDLAARRGVSLVFLYRRDFLRMTVSRLHVRGTMPAHPNGEAAVLKVRESTRVSLPTGSDLIRDLDHTRAKFAMMDAWRAEAGARGVAIYEAIYEDFVGREVDAFAALAGYLTRDLDSSRSTCDPAALPPLGASDPHWQQIHTAPTSTYVANWDAVVATLNGSAYAAFAREDAPFSSSSGHHADVAPPAP